MLSALHRDAPRAEWLLLILFIDVLLVLDSLLQRPICLWVDTFSQTGVEIYIEVLAILTNRNISAIVDDVLSVVRKNLEAVGSQRQAVLAIGSDLLLIIPA